MKLFILTAALLFGLNAMATTVNPTVNEKILKTFNEVFTNARNVQWSTTAEYSEASFSAGSVSSRAMFDNNGKLIRTIRYYNENHLPSNIVYKLKKKYEGREIYGVTEVTNKDGINYNVVLRDSKNIYNVAVAGDGTITLSKKFKRGDI
ncbi:hypothetical protein A8C56_22265 [Niabella ginsenosidivorans]|uniref:Beta-lactamase-inhibitor-like PepSY-like domain-containing protein n=1 Tax=Niabella ginsenosidivorans TaxID=1176587 RepID=A0A1A9I9X5_9BACT|nr:hypothetical protein [Niabella ginsenosidivorans]ANH83344.1 hypothetical protein A8C56_22265 [Niabella ginsenosidivorans]